MSASNTGDDENLRVKLLHERARKKALKKKLQEQENETEQLRAQLKQAYWVIDNKSLKLRKRNSFANTQLKWYSDLFLPDARHHGLAGEKNPIVSFYLGAEN